MTTIAFAFTTHGAFLTQKNAEGVDQPVPFLVPNGMNVYVVSAAVPTVCNIVTDEEIDAAVKYLIDVYCNPDPVTKECLQEPVQAQNIVSTIQRTIPELKTQFQKTKEKVVTATPNPDEDEKMFMFYSDRTYTTRHYSGGMQIYDKIFSRRSTDEKGSEYDLRFTVLTKKNTPDFLLERPDAVVQLSTIIQKLHEKGFINVILYDFSCGSTPFIKKGRTERAVRRGITTSGKTLIPKKSRKTWRTLNIFHKGGTRRRQVKKTKTRRAKKRTVQWRH